MKNLILASSSPARRELLGRLKIPFTAISPDVDETPLPGEDAHALVLRLAEMKARKIADNFPDALIIGCDQVGTFKGTLLNKPETHETAVAQLTYVSGQMVRFLTGMCLLDASTGKLQSTVEIYDVFFRELTPDIIQRYLHKEEALQCAGSFHVEGLGIRLIHKLQGDDYTALIGLPLIKLVSMLEHESTSYID